MSTMKQKPKLFVGEIGGMIAAALMVAVIIAAVQTSNTVKEQRDRLAAEYESGIVEYLDSIDARFQNDEQLSVDSRIEILREDHRLNADQLGTLELMKKEHDEKHSELVRAATGVLGYTLAAIMLGVTAIAGFTVFNGRLMW